MPQPRQTAAAKARAKSGRQSPGNAPDSQGESPSESDLNARADSPASSPGSAPAATASSPFVGDTGSWEPRESAPAGPAGELPDQLAPVPLLADWWTPEKAEKVLRGQGALTHWFIGVGERDWQWQPAELDAVAPSMADACNRVELLRRLAPYADAIGAAMGVGSYVGRSLQERRAVLAGQPRPEPQPVTGVPADQVPWRVPSDAPAPAPASPQEGYSAPPAAPAAEPEETERVTLTRRAHALTDVLQRGRERAAAPTPTTDPAATEIDWRLPQ